MQEARELVAEARGVVGRGPRPARQEAVLLERLAVQCGDVEPRFFVIHRSDIAEIIDDWHVSGLRGTIDGEAGGRTLVRVSVEPEATRLPYASWWMFTWRRDEQGAWKVRSIRLLEGDAGGAWR